MATASTLAAQAPATAREASGAPSWRELAVAAGLAGRDGGERLPHLLLEGGAATSSASGASALPWSI